jgi:hypothetical protein
MATSGSTSTNLVDKSMYQRKEYLVLDKEGVHEYTIVVEDTDKGEKFSILTSNGEQWSSHARNELQLSFINDGNGIKFDRKLKSLDYSELCCLRLLIKFENIMNGNDLNIDNFRVVEMKTLLEL